MTRRHPVTALRCLAAGLVLGVMAGSLCASPRSDYLLHCGGCHLENGAGTPPEVPDLRRDLDWLASTDAGRSYLTRVPGASQVPLSDTRLAAVYNWIFDTYYPQDMIHPFSGKEISATRGLPLYDPLSARQQLTTENSPAR